MHGYYWGFRGMPRGGRFACLNYMDSPLGFWLMIGFVVLVVVGIVLLALNLRKRNHQSNDDSEAMAIIKRRYAKGELTNEEFLKLKKDLQ